MAKFKFRLATLLRLREFARDERRSELARAYRADEIIAGEEQLLMRDLARRYELVLTAQKQHVHQQRQAVRAEIEKRRRALVEANRGVRVLEELREKQRRRHRGNEQRLEIKQLDEVAQQRSRQEDDR